MDLQRPANAPADDLSALAWVLEELRKSLELAHKGLRRYLREVEASAQSDLDDVEPTILRNARQQLHGAVGALQLVNEPAGALLLRTSETAVQRYVARPQRVDAKGVEAIERASFALLDYFGRRLAGKPAPAVGLFPQFKTLLELNGAERVHPADLWSQDWRWALVAPVARVPHAVDAALLADVERRMLALVKQNAPDAAAGLSRAFGAAALQVREVQPAEATLWAIAAAFFEAWGLGLIEPDNYVKRTGSRAMAALRARVKGDPDVSERLAQDLLFYCARAVECAPGQSAPHLAAVRLAYVLAPEEPVDYNQPRYGRHDPAQIVQARKRVASAKEVWNGVAGAEPARLAHLHEAFSLVGDSMRKLYPGGGELADALLQAADQTARAGHAPAPQLAMEVATSLLYLEAALDDGELDQPDQGRRATDLARRIGAVAGGAPAQPLEPWMEELYRRVSDRQTMGSVVQELRSSLSEVERQIDQFFRSPGENALLVAVPDQLTAMRGVFAVLTIAPAMQAVARMRADVEQLLHGDGDPRSPFSQAAFQRLASNLGALGFLIDMLSVQPQMTRQLFRFDMVSGVLAPVMGRSEMAPDLIDRAQAIAEAARRGEVSLAQVSAEIAALSQEAQVSVQPDLAATLSAAQEVLVQASEAGAGHETEHVARFHIAQAMDDFVATATSPMGLEPIGLPLISRPMSLGDEDGKPQFVPTGLEDDDEMRGVFLDESAEVLGEAHAALESLNNAPSDLAALTTVRRAFHTLKGSSRMVGFNAFGEAAWAGEQLYNHVLAEQTPASADLRTFTADALAYFAAWVSAIGRGDESAFKPDPVIAAADTLRLAGELLRIHLPGALAPSTPAQSDYAGLSDLVDLEVPLDVEPAAPVVETLQATQPVPSLPAEVMASAPIELDLVLDLDLDATPALTIAPIDELPAAPPAAPAPVAAPAEAPFTIEALQPSTPPAEPPPIEAPVAVPEPVFGDAPIDFDPFDPAQIERIEVGLEEHAADSPDGWRAGLTTSSSTLSDAADLPPAVQPGATDEVLPPPLVHTPEPPVPADLEPVAGLDAAETRWEAEPLPYGEADAGPDSAPAPVEPPPEVVPVLTEVFEIQTVWDAVPPEAIEPPPAEAPFGESLAEPVAFDTAGEPFADLGAEAPPPVPDRPFDEQATQPIDAPAAAPVEAPEAYVVDLPTETVWAPDASWPPAPPVEASPQAPSELVLEASALPPDETPAAAFEETPPPATELPLPIDGLTVDEAPSAEGFDFGPADAAPPPPAGDAPEVEAPGEAETTEARGGAAVFRLDDFRPSSLQALEVVEGVAGEDAPGLAPTPEAAPVFDSRSAGLDEAANDHRLILGRDEDDVKVVGPLRLQIPLFNIYLNEADELSRRLSNELALWALELDRPVGSSAVALAHSLAGSSATVGFADLSRLARALEHALGRAQGLGQGEAADAELFVAVADEIRRLLHQFAAGFLHAPPAELHERLEAWMDAAASRAPARPPESQLGDTGLSTGGTLHTDLGGLTLPTGWQTEPEVIEAAVPVAPAEAPEPEPVAASSAGPLVELLADGQAFEAAPPASPPPPEDLAPALPLLPPEIESLSLELDDTLPVESAPAPSMPAPIFDALPPPADVDLPLDLSTEPPPAVDAGAPWSPAIAATTPLLREAPPVAEEGVAGELPDIDLAELAPPAPLEVDLLLDAPAAVDTALPAGPAAAAPDEAFEPDEAFAPVAPPAPAPAAARPPAAPWGVAAVAPPAPAPQPFDEGALLAGLDEDIDQVDQVDPELFPIFDEEAQELLPQLAQQVAEWRAAPADTSLGTACMRKLHTFKGSARLAGAMRLGELAHRFESVVERLVAAGVLLPVDSEELQRRVDVLGAVFDALRRTHGAPPATTLGLLNTPTVSGAWPSRPGGFADSRFDGRMSGLMSGLMGLGGPHDAPPAVPAELPEPESLAAELSDGEIDWARFGHDFDSLPAQPAERTPVNVQPVRVRAALLDRLVNLAGEVSITRARLESEVASIRGSLTDLNDNLDRLGQQLRDLTLQAETQLESRMQAARAAAQEFDPLELDRYTRLQELTRMMAESVNDVATVRSAMQRTLQTTEDELAVQARLTRELQGDLLRTRMIEFESLSERLYRVVRLAAKETGKQVRFDIVGGSIEVDRGVLDRMTAAFEHLLRNCVTHGIETSAERERAGKDPTGSIVVELEQDGNEVSIEVRDDGAGLDLARIRERAEAMGVVEPGAALDEAQLANLIFVPGLSTMVVVTELAGRGVGMDVVRSEVHAMGGRIETRTTAGRGTRFRLVLPLTTVVTQVVLLRAGAVQIAVPSNLVELVQRAAPYVIEAAYEQGAYSYGGLQLPFFWLGALLEAGGRGVETGRTLPVVIVRSAQQRVALHVDEVQGSHEVVVKNLGPQLSRLPGLAGMTLLPSGAVALIYNPVALAAVYGPGAVRLMQLATATRPAEPADEAAQAAARPAPLVLVVDDSLTVRRVTKRLLEREGYRVALAKDGLEALDALTGERPVAVLSDIEMPRMDGFDLLRNIRGDAGLASLPVIMITSRIAKKHRDLAVELGANHYLGKPYSEEELLGVLRQHASVQRRVTA